MLKKAVKPQARKTCQAGGRTPARLVKLTQGGSNLRRKDVERPRAPQSCAGSAQGCAGSTQYPAGQAPGMCRERLPTRREYSGLRMRRIFAAGNVKTSQGNVEPAGDDSE